MSAAEQTKVPTWGRPYQGPGRASSKVISVVTGKGGTGKTSISTSLAGLVAANGRRALVVDLDPQGHCAGNLGVDPELDDRGASLLAALGDPDGAPVEIVSGITVEVDGCRFDRTDLGLICGGEHLAQLGTLFASRIDHSGELPQVRYDSGAVLRLRAVLARVIDDYDLVVIDCPPGEAYTQIAALAASRFVLVPTSSDDRSIEAVATVAARFSEVRPLNADLQLLGLVLFAVGSAETAVRRRALEYVEAVMGTQVPVFETFIRDVRAAADACRREGVLPHELEILARARPSAWPASAGSLADDYDRLSFEVLGARRRALTEARARGAA